jgi:hypothetical protein
MYPRIGREPRSPRKQSNLSGLYLSGTGAEREVGVSRGHFSNSARSVT